MAEPNVDIAQLDESQQSALQTYTAVTNQDHAAAIPLLQRSQWNVQIAIAKFFDGETADPVVEARASLESSSTPRQAAHRETLLNGSPSFPRSPASSAQEPAPRVVPQPDDRVAHRPPFILSLVFTPFNLLYRLLSNAFGIFSYLFPFLPRLLSNRRPTASSQGHVTGRRPLTPRDTAARFVREFEEEYGSHSLHFFEGGYAQAYDIAKKDLKYLLVVLISPEHDDTSIFVRETILSSDVAQYINNPQNNIILWAGNVQDSESYQVSIALNCSKFPFSALIVHTPQDSSMSMSTIARITGLTPPATFIAKLQTAIRQQSAALERVRSTRAEQAASRNIREEQNSAYDRSLAQDRERARQRKEAEAAKARAEQDAEARAELERTQKRKIEQWRRWKASKLAPEPGLEIKDATRLSIRLPAGHRVIRRFTSGSEIEDVYAFVECFEYLESDQSMSNDREPSDFEHRYSFNLVSPMPREVYDLKSGGSIGSRIGRSGNLIVETLDEGEDDT